MYHAWFILRKEHLPVKCTMHGSFGMHIQLQNCDNYLTFTPQGRFSITAYMGRLCLKVGMWREYYFSIKWKQNGYHFCQNGIWGGRGLDLRVESPWKKLCWGPLPPQDLYTSQIIVQHEQFDLHCFTTEYPYNICADVLLIKIVFVLCSKTLHDTKYETNWLCYGTQSSALLWLVTGHKQSQAVTQS